MRSIKILSSLVCLIIISLSATAYSGETICGEECLTAPTCVSLGYSKDANCPEGSLKCPFDTSYIWCKSYTCELGRYDAFDKGNCTQVSYHGLTCYNCNCAKFTLSSCPLGAICDDCDGKFRITDCKSGWLLGIAVATGEYICTPIQIILPTL